MFGLAFMKFRKLKKPPPRKQKSFLYDIGLKLFSMYYSEFSIDVIRMEFGKGL